MIFRDRLKEKFGATDKRNIALILSGDFSSWDRNQWWKTVFPTNAYIVDVFVVTSSTSELKELKRSIDRLHIAEETLPDAADLAVEMADRKRLPWDVSQPALLKHATQLYALLRCSFLKSRIEILNAIEYEICFNIDVNHPVERTFAPLEILPNTTYSFLNFDHPLRYEMDSTFYYSDSATFNRSAMIFRLLPLLRRESFDPGWDGVKTDLGDEIPIGLVMYFQHMLMRLSVTNTKAFTR